VDGARNGETSILVSLSGPDVLEESFKEVGGAGSQKREQVLRREQGSRVNRVSRSFFWSLEVRMKTSGREH
jgi:hypothetical protein